VSQIAQGFPLHLQLFAQLLSAVGRALVFEAAHLEQRGPAGMVDGRHRQAHRQLRALRTSGRGEPQDAIASAHRINESLRQRRIAGKQRQRIHARELALREPEQLLRGHIGLQHYTVFVQHQYGGGKQVEVVNGRHRFTCLPGACAYRL